MFGLPFATTLLVFGFPLFWICYLVVFLYVSRDWDKDAAQENDAS
jgi:hypothetical protein